MKAVLLIILLLVSFAAGGLLFHQRSPVSATVEVSRFHRLAADKNAVIIDVRTADEYSAGHLPAAVNSDYYNQAQFTQFLDSLDKNRYYLLYCRSGNRSRQARMLMAAKGFTRVSDLDGGIIAWQAANFPVTSP